MLKCLYFIVSWNSMSSCFCRFYEWIHCAFLASQIETMTYCADMTNSRLINKLRDKIDQVNIIFVTYFCFLIHLSSSSVAAVISGFVVSFKSVENLIWVHKFKVHSAENLKAVKILFQARSRLEYSSACITYCPKKQAFWYLPSAFTHLHHPCVGISQT